MIDTRLHNDCDGGHCVACGWDEMQAKLRADRRAWFDPGASNIATPEEVGRMEIEDAIRATLPKLKSRK